MKKITLAILLCGFGMSLFGQGILSAREAGKRCWRLAKKENKTGVCGQLHQLVRTLAKKWSKRFFL